MKTQNGEAILWDCLEVMKSIPDGSVDCIITDPPYWTVSNICSSDWFYHWMKWKTLWDTALSIKDIFNNAERTLKTNWYLILFSQEPYTSQLITQAHWNLPFLYRMVWKKDHFANALIAKKAPVSYYEDILVFAKKYDSTLSNSIREYSKKLFSYIWRPRKDIFNDMWNQWIDHFMRYDSLQFDLCTKKAYQQLIDLYSIDKMQWYLSYEYLKHENKKYYKTFNLPQWKKIKSNILEYKKDYDWFHPTQKPVELIEDLIKTYTNEWETVLDFTAWSFTTAVACENTNRKWICIEKEQEYFDIWIQRLNNLKK